jgi:hypothetical protein
MGEFEAVWAELEVFWVIGSPKGGSEKGSSRESTKNRVARWRNLFWGNFMVLRWFVKKIFLEEFQLGVFLGFARGSTWGHWGGGTVYVSFCAFGGILGVTHYGVGWGGLASEGARVYLETTEQGRGS